jgi:hypothetical protein
MARTNPVSASLLGAALVALAMLSSPQAWARQEYYDAIASQTGTCADCRLCHKGPVGDATSFDLSKPFTLYMVTSGRLGTIPDATQDSDGDGYPDLQELQEFGDPNDPLVGPGQFECPAGASPEYGCVRIARGPSVPDGWALLAAALPALLLWRRRR